MPTPATTEQKEIIRREGQGSITFMDFRVPNVIYTARLASVPSTTDMIAQISFNSGSGTLADVLADMVLWVGTSAGAYDLGICRIRKAPISGTFYIGEQSKVNWQANCYLTVLDDFDLWAKHLRMDGTTPKMDYEVTYADQHSAFNPVPVLGPLVRVKKLTGASVQVVVGSETGIQSYCYGSSISSYAWTCATAVSFSSSSVARPTVTFDAPGWHVLYCTVTAANGKSKRGVRYVYIWDEDHLPFVAASVENCDESMDEGGMNFDIQIPEGATLSEIPYRALCVMFSVDYYGVLDEQEEVSVGPVSGVENVVAYGRVNNQQSSYDHETKTLNLQIVGWQALFRQLASFPVGVEMAGTATAWTNMAGLTVDKGLWHFLEWRTTATVIMDIIPSGDTRYTKETASMATNLWSQMQEIAFEQILANIHIDQYGRLWVEIDPLLIPESDRDYPVMMELEAQDIHGDVQFESDNIPNVSQVSLSGVAVTTGGTAVAYFALSPGHVFDRFGSIETMDRLLLVSQAQANELAGLVFAARNNDLSQLRLKLNANNRLISCFPNQAVTFTIPADKNPRGVEITRNFIPRRRRLRYSSEIGFWEIELELEAETTAEIAVKTTPPGSGDLSVPPVPTLPPLPDISIVLPGTTPGSNGGPPKVLVNDRGTLGNNGIGLCYTDKFNTSSPHWWTVNNGLTQAQYQQIDRVVRTPNGTIYVGVCSGFGSSSSFLARAPYIGGTFEIIEDQTSINAKFSNPAQPDNRMSLLTFACDNINPERVVYVIANQNANTGKIYMGSGSEGFTHKQDVSGGMFYSGSISYGNNAWILTGGSPGGLGFAPIWKKYNADFSSLLASGGSPLSNLGLFQHTRVLSTPKLFVYVCLNGANFNKIAFSDDNLATATQGIGSDYSTDFNLNQDDSMFAVDPTGTFIMTMRLFGSGAGKSSDAGATLVDISTLPVSGADWYFAYCGGAGSASRWIAGSVYCRYSDDFGVTWADKQGNLPTLNPLFAINAVKVIEQ